MAFYGFLSPHVELKKRAWEKKNINLRSRIWQNCCCERSRLSEFHPANTTIQIVPYGFCSCVQLLIPLNIFESRIHAKAENGSSNTQHHATRCINAFSKIRQGHVSWLVPSQDSLVPWPSLDSDPNLETASVLEMFIDNTWQKVQNGWAGSLIDVYLRLFCKLLSTIHDHIPKKMSTVEDPVVCLCLWIPKRKQMLPTKRKQESSSLSARAPPLQLPPLTLS